MAVQSSDSDARPDPRSAHILLVDDEEPVRTVMRRILERAGYRITEAATGPEAVRIAREHAGDLQLLVTDIVMPEMDGWAVADAVTAAVPGVAVLFVSGYAGGNDAAYSRALGAQRSFLPKPFSAPELMNAVRALVG